MESLTIITAPSSGFHSGPRASERTVRIRFVRIIPDPSGAVKKILIIVKQLVLRARIRQAPWD